MSKIEEQKPIIKDSWTNQELKEFEQELDDRSFEKWAIDNQLYVVNEKYPKGAISYERSQDYYWARKKMSALENLQERRKYAQKMEQESFNQIEF